MTSDNPLVEPWKVRDFITELEKHFKRREPLAANFTKFCCIEEHRRFQLIILVSIKPHRGIISKSLDIREDAGAYGSYEEFSVQGNTYSFPIGILAFEQYHKENGFAGAIIDILIHRLDDYGALGPVNRNG